MKMILTVSVELVSQFAHAPPGTQQLSVKFFGYQGELMWLVLKQARRLIAVGTPRDVDAVTAITIAAATAASREGWTFEFESHRKY